MDTAQQLRKSNIAEYILYLWQLEDMFRALQFSPEAIYSGLIKPRNLSPEHSNILLTWYVELTELLQKEGKEQKGHLDHTMHLIADLNNLHLQLLKLPIGAQYRATFARLEEVIPDLRQSYPNSSSDIELCFRALYATMLYRIKGQAAKGAVTDTIEYISPCIALLSKMYGQIERGEVNLFQEE